MPNVSVARRYARALLDVTAEAHALDVVSAQLTMFVAAIELNQELNDILVNPAYSRSQRTAVVDAVMSAMGTSHPLLVSTIRLLTDRNRLDTLPDIARQFRDMADARAGRVRGRVTSATPLPADLVRRIEEALERLTQRNVVLETRVDPSVLGGVSAQVGSFLYDGTLRTQLETMRRQLKST